MVNGKILVVSPTYHPEKVGTPHYVTDLVQELRRHGEQPHVLTAQPFYPAFVRFPGYGRSRRYDEFGGVPIFRVPTLVPRRGAPLWRALSEVNFAAQLIAARLARRVSSAERVLAVSPGVPFAVLGAIIFRRRRGRLVVIVHDVAYGLASTAVGGVWGYFSRILQRLEVMILNRADHVTVLSGAMGAELERVGVHVPISTVPLWPTVSRPGVGPPKEPLTVLYSGNLGRKQGVHRLIEVAAAMQREVPEAVLVIRGDGSERARIARDIRLRALPNVRLEPFVDANQLAATLSAAHVHIVPQDPEGAAFAVPSKIFNILAVGRPVVITAEPGSALAEIAREVPAVVCADPHDRADLGRRVVRLLRDGDDREERAETGPSWIAAGHNRSGAAAKYLRLLATTSG